MENMKILPPHQCPHPECEYVSDEFASVAMHYMRCHATRNGDGEIPNRKLRAKFDALERRFRAYRESHP